jgi:molybdate transport system ATP-binding protein
MLTRYAPQAMTTHNSTSPPLLSLRNVDVDIEGAPILRGIDLQLTHDRHWGIVGRNGCGKTTLLGLIAGSIWPAPDRGVREYFFAARVWRDAVEARRRIATVGPEFQDRYARWGWNFSALDVVLTGIFRTDIPRRQAQPAERRRARALLDEFALTALAERPFLELSRGEQRRILIARAMAFEPAMLVLDEPASGLDAAARQALDAQLTRLSSRTVIVSSAHSEQDLPRVITDVLHLEEGRVVARHAAGSKHDAAANIPGLRPVRNAALREAGEVLIAVEHADIWLGGRRVLHDICWQLRDGEHWLIRGANGAGKSSFLRLLHGQMRPALGGSIRWPGLHNPRNVWALRRQVGFVSPEFQAAYRYPTTVRECIASGFDSSVGLTRPLRNDENERVDVLLDRFALEQFASRALNSLSYGQMRRALLARAFANRPRVLLLDEPWAGLDALTSELVGDQLAASMHDGTQIVCVSHLATGARGFTHTLELDGGRWINRGDENDERRESSASEQRPTAH